MFGVHLGNRPVISRQLILPFSPLLAAFLLSPFLFGSAVTLAQETSPVTITITDENGTALPGVEAIWHRGGKGQLLSDEAGKISVPKKLGLLAVRKNGFGYAGIQLESIQGNSANITLRTPGSPGQKRSTRSFEIDPQQRKSLLDSIAADCRKNIENNPNDQRGTIQSLVLLSRIEPKQVLRQLDEKPMSSQFETMIRQTAVASLATTDPDLAIEVADGSEEPMFRASIMNRLLTKLPKDDPRRAAVEEQYLDTIRTIPQPQLRLAMLAGLAERYQLAGQPDKAKTIVDEHLEAAKQLPSAGWSAYPRSLFAALIVNDDFEAATKMIEGIDKDSERNRALGRLAFHCCREKPNEAIGLLKQIKYPETSINSGRLHIKVAHRMAVEQTEAAIQVANMISEPNEKAWALGMIAHRLAGSGSAKASEQAKTILASAIDVLNHPDALPGPGSHFSSAATMAGLLPVFEAVNSDALESTIWNATWLAIPRSRWSSSHESNLAKLQNAASAIARYDFDLAKALNQQKEVDGFSERALLNQFVFDCNAVSSLLQRADDANGFARNTRLREKALEVLNCDQDSLWQTISQPQFMQWPTERYEDH